MKNEIEMMRVLRVPPLGKLMIEVGGNRIENLSEISNPKVKQRLLTAIGELIVAAGGYQELVAAGVAAPLRPEPAPGVAAEDTAVTESLEEERRNRFLSQLEAQRDAYKSPRMSSQAPTVSIAEPSALPPEENAQQLSIVEQIDAILQKYVAANPELVSRSIHLTQNPTGGLRIQVDGAFYERPREIDDANVQKVIKQALKEWESN